MHILKKAVSAEIFIPLETKTCQPSCLLINGIPIASFPAHEAISNLPSLLDKMEDALDSCKNVATIMRNVIMKNA